MKRRPMSELAIQIRGVSYKPADLHSQLDSDSVILLRANNIDNGKLNFDDVVFVDRNRVSQSQYLQRGDILICASNGSLNLVGKAAQVKENGEYTFGAFCKVVRPLNISEGYLGAFFQSPCYRRTISTLAQGANINNIKNEHIDALLVNYPAENVQAEITNVLNSVAEIIEKRKQQLAALDTLIKARFVEMFGEPTLNPRGWKIASLKNVAAEKLSYGSGAPAIDYDGKCRYVRITDINENGELNKERKSPDNFSEKYLLHDGDILFARSGATVGKTFKYNAIKHGCCIYAGYLIKFTPNTDIVLSDYVYWFTKTNYYISFVKNAQRAVAQPNINAQEYGDLEICLPPIEIQTRFAAFVTQVDKSKAVVQQALNEAQVLFDSLMQEYFG